MIATPAQVEKNNALIRRALLTLPLGRPLPTKLHGGAVDVARTAGERFRAGEKFGGSRTEPAPLREDGGACRTGIRVPVHLPNFKPMSNVRGAAKWVPCALSSVT